MEYYKRSLNTYYKHSEKYKKQYGKFITDTFGILKIKVEELENEEGTTITQRLTNLWEDFEVNFNNEFNCYNAEDIKKYFKENEKEETYKINDNFSIGKAEFNKHYNLIKFDKINVKTRLDLDMMVLELIKNNKVIGYLLPCRKY